MGPRACPKASSCKRFPFRPRRDGKDNWPLAIDTRDHLGNKSPVAARIRADDDAGEIRSASNGGGDAEGATAPETLRSKDRIVKEALWKADGQAVPPKV